SFVPSSVISFSAHGFLSGWAERVLSRSPCYRTRAAVRGRGGREGAQPVQGRLIRPPGGPRSRTAVRRGPPPSRRTKSDRRRVPAADRPDGKTTPGAQPERGHLDYS